MNNKNKNIISMCNEEDQDKLLRWLTKKLSPVMLRVKPSIMIRVSNCPWQIPSGGYDLFCIRQREILSSLDLEAFILGKCRDGALALFYDREFLLETLRQPGNHAFLTDFGYEYSDNPDSYLHCLKKHYDNGEFPHEVGIFLGYPLKDVMGFVYNKQDSYCSSLKCGWRVYGSPEESIRLKKTFTMAETLAGMILNEFKDVQRCIHEILRRKGTINL